MPPTTARPEVDEDQDPKGLPLWSLLMVYVSYGFIMVMGYLKEYLGKLFGEPPAFITPEGYAPLFVEFEYFYTRRMFQRIRDLWDRPVTGVPGAYIDVLERTSNNYNETFTLTGKKKSCLNLGSYNYLGFADNKGPVIEDVLTAVKQYGIETASASAEGGHCSVHDELEKLVAEFVGKEDSIVFEMGFATNSTTIPALVGKGGLIISDSLNHASLVVGCRSSGAKIKVFKHNDPADLERVVRESIVEGQPRTHRPWNKILILVEGIYSMEGEVLKLKEIIDVKKKYKCYLYVDEAHSIGAIGPNGRGICDYWGVDPAQVDILMGTFTKSFGSVGGYIAGSKELITYLRQTSFGWKYATSMSPPCAQQALSALKVIMGRDGTDTGAKKLLAIRQNSDYFRGRLRELGFLVLGDQGSPVIPMMMYYPAKLPAFSRACLEKGIAVVMVGFPATPLIASRTRFCISAAHTREDLDWALEEISKIGDQCMLKYGKWYKSPTTPALKQ